MIRPKRAISVSIAVLNIVPAPSSYPRTRLVSAACFLCRVAGVNPSPLPGFRPGGVDTVRRSGPPQGASDGDGAMADERINMLMGKWTAFI